jgi:hypothetical protein
MRTYWIGLGLIAIVAAAANAATVDTYDGYAAEIVSEDVTITTEDGRLLVAFVSNRGNDGDGFITVNSMAYGGEDFAHLEDADANATNDSYGPWSQVYYLVNPQGGTNKFEYTLNGGNRGESVILVSLYDCPGQAPAVFGTDGGQKSDSTSVTATPPADAEMLLSGAVVRHKGNTFTATEGLTELMEQVNSYGSPDKHGAVSVVGYKDVSESGATSVGWMMDSNDYAHSVIAIVPEPATMSLLALGGLVALRRRRK